MDTITGAEPKPVIFNKTPEEMKEFEQICELLEEQTYEGYANEAEQIQAAAKLDVDSGFWSDQLPVGTVEDDQ